MRKIPQHSSNVYHVTYYFGTVFSVAKILLIPIGRTQDNVCEKTMSRIIITDVHGCYDTLVALVAKLPKGIPITFAGDLIDRGPKSRQVVEFVKDGGHDCVLGNHEKMMMNELHFRPKHNEPEVEQVFINGYDGIWERNGGDVCLWSYLINQPIDPDQVLPKVHDIAALKDHVAWMKTLPLFLEYNDVGDDKGRHLLVTHSTAAAVWGSLDPCHPGFENAILWDRDPSPPAIEGIFNVYGHTPQKGGATVKDHFACIDTGCAYNNNPNYGKLTAIQFPEMILFEQENVEELS